MNDDSSPTLLPRRGLLAGTIKVAVCVAVLSFAATHFLSNAQLDRQSMNQLVARVTGGVPYDPPTTGSIGGAVGAAAASTRLDPCAMDLRRR